MTFGGWRGAAWRCVALTVTLLAASPVVLRAQSTECEPGELEVRALDFKGNREFRASDLALRIVTSPSEFLRRSLRILGTRRCLDSDEMRLDVGRLRVFYRRHGYFNTKVDTLVTPVRDGYGGVRVAFLIDEGTPVLVDTLRISGLTGIIAPIADTTSLSLRSGIVFDVSRLQVAIDSVKARLRNNGYPRGDVAASFSVDSIRQRANVNLDVLPGTRASIAAIRVTDEPLPGAPRKLSDQTILQLLGVHPGDLYRERELIDAQRTLYQTDLFRHVEIKIANDSTTSRVDSLVTLDVLVAENYLRQVDTEEGWAVLDCFKARV
ncbi:MAG: POTRA domain-containing protein, partial [Gemmatimonadaceae bacterium]